MNKPKIGYKKSTEVDIMLEKGIPPYVEEGLRELEEEKKESEGEDSHES